MNSPQALTREFESAAIRKVTARLIPLLFVLYVAAYLDRINIGFAQLQMKQMLGFSDAVYGLGAGIFFIGYFLFEVPSNLILAKVGARRWIARIMITWGLISSAMTIVHTPVTFYALRFLLGVAEAGLFPGVIYYLSRWFPAAERASATSRFMTAMAVSGIIGGPLSGALLGLDGVAGLAGWQWIFLAEGIPSVGLGVAVLFLLPDGPQDAKWLSPKEQECLSARIRTEAQTIASRGHFSVGSALMHPIVWRLSLLIFTIDVGLYSISFWLPQIVKAFSGLNNSLVAFLSAIPYIAAALAMVAAGTHSDRSGERCLHIAAAAATGAIGLALTAYVHSPMPGLLALSIAAAGIFSAIPIFWSLPSSLLTGAAAAGAIALINAIGGLSGFVGPYFVGYLRGATGSFAFALSTIAVLLLSSAAIALSLRQTPLNVLNEAELDLSSI